MWFPNYQHRIVLQLLHWIPPSKAHMSYSDNRKYNFIYRIPQSGSRMLQIIDQSIEYSPCRTCHRCRIDSTLRSCSHCSSMLINGGIHTCCFLNPKSSLTNNYSKHQLCCTLRNFRLCTRHTIHHLLHSRYHIKYNNFILSTWGSWKHYTKCSKNLDRLGHSPRCTDCIYHSICKAHSCFVGNIRMCYWTNYNVMDTPRTHWLTGIKNTLRCYREHRCYFLSEYTETGIERIGWAIRSWHTVLLNTICTWSWHSMRN